MAKKGKLKSALDTYKGKDSEVERQKELQKKARKLKTLRQSTSDSQSTVAERTVGSGDNQLSKEEEQQQGEEEGDGNVNRGENIIFGDDEAWEDEESDDAEGDDAESIDEVIEGIDLSRIDDTSSESGFDDPVDEDNDDDDDDVKIQGVSINGHKSDFDSSVVQNGDASDEEDEEDIPLSDLSSLSSTAKEDILPHQRLTINNTSALLRSLKTFSLPISQISFSEHQSITTSEPVTITDINDDLSRELAFYKQSLEAVNRARRLLKDEGMPFTRPGDYFAEMVKSDEQMGRVKQKLMDEASRRKAGEEARRQRDARKFGKQVQVAKLQERDKMRKEMEGKVKELKRKRRNAPDTGGEREKDNNLDDVFDVGLDDATDDDNNRRQKRQRPSTSTGSRHDGKKNNGNGKRQKRDAKFGFGGKKRFGKSNDALSTGDFAGRFGGGDKRAGGGRSSGGAGGKGRPSKSGGLGNTQKRLGKSRRVKTH